MNENIKCGGIVAITQGQYTGCEGIVLNIDNSTHTAEIQITSKRRINEKAMILLSWLEVE